MLLAQFSCFPEELQQELQMTPCCQFPATLALSYRAENIRKCFFIEIRLLLLSTCLAQGVYKQLLMNYLEKSQLNLWFKKI